MILEVASFGARLKNYVEVRYRIFRGSMEVTPPSLLASSSGRIKNMYFQLAIIEAI